MMYNHNTNLFIIVYLQCVVIVFNLCSSYCRRLTTIWTTLEISVRTFVGMGKVLSNYAFFYYINVWCVQP